MPAIEKFVVDKKKESISWSCFGQTRNKTIPGLDQAIVESKNGNILVLAGANGSPNKLVILDGEGRISCELSPPEGFQFYYLSNHPEIGGAVVCVTDESIDGWNDWFFGIDFSNASLFRHCPAH
ncbi:hypothetical protein [Marinobacter confluentis]|uniref:Uncharacterized protein n=1 Tax=Marinobacter confluentis TaxID=1697557 RepID=A0A4Z1BPB8_9GAMM|nr:hypothetical protein [Marinobacter confluentis]TGN38851.1 hypothetical protein E5Q11_14055 [Marinobacter confluentis]